MNLQEIQEKILKIQEKTLEILDQTEKVVNLIKSQYWLFILN